MFGIGPTELLVILAILVLLFGAKKLPELSRGVGESMKELRKGMRDDEPSGKKERDTSDKSSE